ncbi:MAG: porin family protein [Campylobacterales bacterium]|nr:porin family protein [Campylobacterales bacterium]
MGCFSKITSRKSDGWTSWGSEDHYDDTLTGWTIGAGLEKKINENLHARIQYRYTDYGDDTWELDPSNDPDTGKIEYNAHMLMVGLSYRF